MACLCCRGGFANRLIVSTGAWHKRLYIKQPGPPPKHFLKNCLGDS